MFKFRSNSGQKRSPEPEPEQKCCSGTGTGIPVDLCSFHVFCGYLGQIIDPLLHFKNVGSGATT